MTGMPSLDLLADRVRSERERQLRHFEAIDTKAGVVLGFAGIIVAVGGQTTNALGIGAQIAAAAAALASLLAFLSRDYPVLLLRELRRLYLESDSRFSKLYLLDTDISMVEEGSRLLRQKSILLAIGAVLLATGTILLALEALVR